MTSPTITDADRRCAGTVLGITETPVPVATFDVILRVIAAHRGQARRDALDEAARVAVKHDTGDYTREDMEARRIATAIMDLQG